MIRSEDIEGKYDRRWRCVQCNWISNSSVAARTHFTSNHHMANTYIMTEQDAIDDLLKLREELAR